MTKSETLKTQVAVIGAGPGGYAAAFQAAELGLQVTLINAEPRPGGVCLLRGCIPSKAFLHVAKLINETNESSDWGIAYDRPKIDVDKLRAWKEGIVQKLSGGILQLCKLRDVRVIDARASFEGPNSLTLSASAESPMDIPRTVEFEHAIIATGSRPTIPAPFLIDDPRIMNSTSALDLPDIPGSLLVIGDGYIGLEIGTVYASLGSRVTVVEIADGLFQRETSALLTNERFVSRFSGFVFASADSMGAVAGVEWLEQRGLPVLALAGAITMSPLAVREAVAHTRLKVLGLQQLQDPAHATELLDAGRRRLWSAGGSYAAPWQAVRV